MGLRTFIRQALSTKKAEDTGAFSVLQTTYLGRVGDCVNAMPYGTHSSPPVDTPCIVLIVGNDESCKYVIPLSSKWRPKNLKEGEFVTGNFKVGSIIHFKENGDIDITCKGNLNAQVDGDVNANITGNTDITCPQTTINGNLVVNGLTSLLYLTFLAGGNGTIPSGITINNQGIISGNGNIQSNGIDLATHVHSGVQAGGSNTGQPV